LRLLIDPEISSSIRHVLVRPMCCLPRGLYVSIYIALFLSEIPFHVHVWSIVL
jgi:hypothetical protein